MSEMTYETVLALRIDVSDRDHHIEELKATIVRLNDQIGVADSTSKAYERMWSICDIRFRIQDLINNPRGRSFQAIVEDISELIREEP